MDVNILIGTPCYGGQIMVNYFQSMLRLVAHFGSVGIGYKTKTLAQESLISRARNVIVAEFLGQTEFTHLLFIDADIGFEPATIQRLVDWRKPVVAVACPMKGYDWKKMIKIARAAQDDVDLRTQALSFAFNTVEPANQPPSHTSTPIVNGFVRVSQAGTGLMLIQRDVFARLQQCFPALQYRNDIAGYDNDHTRDNFWTFFDTSVDPVSKRYLSEDYTFCNRWAQGCQGEIWLDIQSTISHYGSAAYRGNFLATVDRRS